MYAASDSVTFRTHLSQQGKARPVVNGKPLTSSLLKNVTSAAPGRPKGVKKRSLCGINEHKSHYFNASEASSVVFQQAARAMTQPCWFSCAPEGRVAKRSSAALALLASILRLLARPALQLNALRLAEHYRITGGVH